MVSVWPWVQTNPATPQTVPTDTIVPVHYWDDTVLCRSAILYDLMRFDDVLDVGLLKTSLENLLGRKGWRKLGARVRLNVSFWFLFCRDKLSFQGTNRY